LRIYVVDASVAVKWFNQENEQNVAEALAVLRDAVAQRVTLLTSDLLRYEVANALTKGKNLTPATVRAMLERLDELPVEFIEITPALFEEAASFAQHYSISVYDAVYAALARAVNGTLMTANPRHQGRVREVAVVALADYPIHVASPDQAGDN
jgi:predicted nucleic acid-binding protein